MLAICLQHTEQLNVLSKTAERIDDSIPNMIHEIWNTVNSVKSVLSYFKRTELSNKLSVSLKQSYEAR